jgi:hypothetical protein
VGGRSRDARRLPLDMIVARTEGYTYNPRKFGICPSFKDRFLSPRVKRYRYDSQLSHRCSPPGL